MTDQKTVVSICCLVYNHEKYLRKCLDGFVMQKTNFIFEVLIHDDASTDRSPEIIREYTKRYPNLFKPIYQKENQHSKRIRISCTFQYPRAQGKYLALCEGDDYWTDPLKLQKQYDAMEANPEASFCAHRVRCVTETGERMEQTYPKDELNSYYSKDEWIRMMLKPRYPLHTSSYFFKTAIIKDKLDRMPSFYIKSPVGDVPLMLLAATEGSLIYIDEEMSCYRKGSIGSWTSRNTTEREIRVLNACSEMYREYNKYTDYEYSNYIDELLLENEYYSKLKQHEIKPLFSSRYKKVREKTGTKEKAFLLMSCLFPSLMDKYKEKKKRRKCRS